ncbi:MAG: class B sortase [Lachnospiraceae bacterium]|nr:class B sortase [Lachnospiraceae bacterium]
MKEKFFLFLSLFFLICACISGFFLFRYYHQSYEQEQQYDEVAAIYYEVAGNELYADDEKTDTENSNLANEDDLQKNTNHFLEELQAINPDCIGWIRIDDTNVDYPVVYKDNSYYLTHNFMNEPAKAGSIFLDENCKASDELLLFHGHHMKNGTMFGDLKNYRKREFADSHETVIFNPGTGEEEYQVFAAALIDLTKDDYFHYEKLPGSKEEKENYLRSFLKVALWKKRELSEEDYEKKMIVLSTCDYGTNDQRLVLLAMKK